MEEGFIKDPLVDNLEVVKETSKLIDKIKSFTEPEFLLNLVFFVAAIFFIWFVYFILKKVLNRVPEQKLKPRVKDIILKILKYTFEALIIIYILSLFGVNLNAIFGAAGIAGVAIGLAAQTSLGNIISGVFILHEHTLKNGDHVLIDGVEGTVESIDLISLKIKTFNNQIVRIPNETLLKTKVENYSVLPNRRICLLTQLDYDADMQKVLPMLIATAEKTENVLANPKPDVICTNFGDNGIEVQITAFAKYADFLKTRSLLISNINEACKKNSLKIMYPVVEVHND